MNWIEALFVFIAIVIAGVCLLVIFGIIRDRQIPDGIIAISGDEDKLHANFILCIPIEDFLDRKFVRFEVRHISADEDDSQEIQEP